jgi:hypothetical protein
VQILAVIIIKAINKSDCMIPGIEAIKVQVIFVLVFSQISCFSQSQLSAGYIVNSKNDPVYGKGIIGRNHKFFWFQQDGMQETHRFFPDEVRCIRFFSGKYYVPKEITYSEVDYKLFKKDIINEKTETFFFEYLLDGIVDLYMFNFNGYQKYYIEKSAMSLQELPFYEYIMKVDGKYYQVRNPVFKEFLKVYMEDSPEICDKIDRINYLGPKSLIKISEEYHHKVCSSYDCVNYTKKLTRHKSSKMK